MGNHSPQNLVPQHQIHVNGEPFEIGQPCTVEGLLVTLKMQDRKVAVALNRGIVPRSNYSAVELSGGDRIEILEAVGGG